LDAVNAESLTDALISADIAPNLAESLVAKLRARGTISESEAKQILFDAMLPIVEKVRGKRYEVRGNLDGITNNADKPLTSYLLPLTSKSPTVILIIGVNGAGKTTTIGKMAKNWTDGGKKVVIAAADTFRAAAGEQLAEWAMRAGAVLITGNKGNCSPLGGSQSGTRVPTKSEISLGGLAAMVGGQNNTDRPPTGAQNSAPTPPKGGVVDPATVAYSAIEYAMQNAADIVMIDTAGRLHNRADLMDELAKITRVIKKLIPEAPHETLLVLDANTGQNALNQIEYFDNVAPLTGLIVTKMDSTAKGGFLATYAAEMNGARGAHALPVYAIGYGETIHDLRPFDAAEYLRKLLDM